MEYGLFEICYDMTKIEKEYTDLLLQILMAIRTRKLNPSKTKSKTEAEKSEKRKALKQLVDKAYQLLWSKVGEVSTEEERAKEHLEQKLDEQKIQINEMEKSSERDGKET